MRIRELGFVSDTPHAYAHACGKGAENRISEFSECMRIRELSLVSDTRHAHAHACGKGAENRIGVV